MTLSSIPAPLVDLPIGGTNRRLLWKFMLSLATISIFVALVSWMTPSSPTARENTITTTPSISTTTSSRKRRLLSHKAHKAHAMSNIVPDSNEDRPYGQKSVDNADESSEQHSMSKRRKVREIDDYQATANLSTTLNSENKPLQPSSLLCKGATNCTDNENNDKEEDNAMEHDDHQSTVSVSINLGENNLDPPTSLPSDQPSSTPSDRPSALPSDQPSSTLSDRPSALPSQTPSSLPSDRPASLPSHVPTLLPCKGTANCTDNENGNKEENDGIDNYQSTVNMSITLSENNLHTASSLPSHLPTSLPCNGTTNCTDIENDDIEEDDDVLISAFAEFIPGLLNHTEHGLILSVGLNATQIAESGKPVQYSNKTYANESSINFHKRPDFGATFVDTTGTNPGGWVYVSNSEVEKDRGGVGAITFDSEGKVLKYKRLLTKTTRNCGGGRTPWDSWISCEETGSGRIWQVDPMGFRDPMPITLGDERGRWESFAYDVRDLQNPSFYATVDTKNGAMARFVPHDVNWTDPWDMLHGDGNISWLLLHPINGTNETHGTFNWTSSREDAKDNAKLYYPFSEGIDIHENSLFFVCQENNLFELDLDQGTYIRQSTLSGLFNGGPDQMKRILTNDGKSDWLFFTEEDEDKPGIHGRDPNGIYFTVLESPRYGDETSGLAFSPNGLHMYVAFQHEGVLFDVAREDGLEFHALSLNVRYHSKEE